MSIIKALIPVIVVTGYMSTLTSCTKEIPGNSDKPLAPQVHLTCRADQNCGEDLGAYCPNGPFKLLEHRNLSDVLEQFIIECGR